MLTSGAIPQGSLVLVTGANGYLGSHIAEAFLKQGYAVRGTARTAEKMEFLKNKWDKEFPGKFEGAVVSDMAQDGAYDEAVKGTSAVVHVASVLSFSSVPEEVINPVLAGTLTALRSAAKTPSVKRFVLTSSSSAALFPKPDVKVFLDETTWNEESSALARSLPLTDGAKPWHVYCASKTEGEKSAWDFMKTEKPQFVLNTVLPNANFGRTLDPAQPASTAGWIRALWAGKTSHVENTPPQYFVNPEDTALLHVAAVTFPSITDSRIWAVSATFTWNQILALLRKIDPTRSLPADLKDGGKDLSIVDNSKGTAILKAFGRDGWVGLEESLRQNVEGLP